MRENGGGKTREDYEGLDSGGNAYGLYTKQCHRESEPVIQHPSIYSALKT